jgi:hypothetical protein
MEDVILYTIAMFGLGAIAILFSDPEQFFRNVQFLLNIIWYYLTGEVNV